MHWVADWGGGGQQQHNQAALGAHRLAVAGGVGQGGGERVPDGVLGVVGVVTRPATVWLVVGDQGKFRKEHKDACVGCGYQRPGTRSGLLLCRPCFVAGMENGRV